MIFFEHWEFNTKTLFLTTTTELVELLMNYGEYMFLRIKIFSWIWFNSCGHWLRHILKPNENQESLLLPQHFIYWLLVNLHFLLI